MSLCPICRRYLCDHTAFERGQTDEEMMAPMTPAEIEEWERNNAPNIARVQEAIAAAKNSGRS